MQFYKTYRYEEQIEKKTIFNRHENIYTSKVEKSFIVNDFLITILIDATLMSPKKMAFFNLSVCLNDCHKKSTDTRKLQ